MEDSILLEIYSAVKLLEAPEDNPVESSKISTAIGQNLQRLMPSFQKLKEDGFLKISALGIVPLLYLTPLGLKRARRLEHESTEMIMRYKCAS